MFRKTERFFKKKVLTYKSLKEYGTQNIKRTTYWLFWVIPVFTKDEVVSGDYEYAR